LSVSAALLAGSVASAFADDGEIFRRQTSSPPGEVMDPEPEGAHAFIKLMNFRVPAQAADGTLLETIDYITYDGETALQTTDAKPLINVFVYGPVIGFEDFSQSGFPGHGKREAYAAVSLDDGATWKRTNLSNSADQSSFTLTTDFLVPDAADPACHHAPEPLAALVANGPMLVDDDDDDDDENGDVLYIEEAEWDELNQNFGRLEVEGEDAPPRARVDIVDACTDEVLFTIRADRDGEFEAERNVRLEDAPYEVIARVDDTDSDPVLVEDTPAEPCAEGECTLLSEYPGDVINIFHAVASNKVLVAWQSRFCSSGFPGYTGGTTDADTIAGYLGIDNTADLYLTDLFGVAGSQASVDYREQEDPLIPGEYDGVGEVPFNCLWSARGVLRENPEDLGTSEVVWFQAERLTSGRRDVNRVETSCTAGGGCGITWQEDPDGLRPGEGEGAGTGWAGATVNSQTDIWFSFIEWEDFDIVDNNGTFEPLADTTLTELGTGRPQPAVPMAVPVRLTNNARCQIPVTGTEETYCNEGVAGAYGIKDQCVGTVDIPLGPQGNLQPICVVDANDDNTLNDGDLPNVANTGASRPRLNLQPRDSDGDGVTDDAWVVIIHEESKGFGRFPYLNDEPYVNEDTFGTRCTDETLENCERDIGKNQWYISFALGTPQTSAALEEDFGLVNNLVAQQNQTNAPEVNWITGTFYPPMNTDDMWDFTAAGISYSIFNTEIARRAALMSQSVAKAGTGTSGLMAMPLFKEGVINQGGPADIMARRIVLPDDFAGEATANPYAFENLACQWYDGEGNATDGTWLYTDGSNPYYPKGLCTAPTINLSNRTPFLCEPSGGSTAECLSPNMTCTEDAAFGQLCITDVDPEDNQLLPKLLSWYECPGWDGTDVSNGGNTGTSTIPGACGTEAFSTLLEGNLDDRSWYMPIDISKAHRGFLDGDYAFMLYAWSPNWKLNAVGRDRYELYTRRSFDGGVSWTTTPADGLASDGVTPYGGDGTTTCETWRDGVDSTTDSHICTEYGAADPEQSRNVTQHISMRITTLDPRYSPTIASMPTEGDIPWVLFEPLDPTDIRRPDRNFVVYETGDNTTVAEGEAEGLNLDYGRAVSFGDDYVVWAEETDLTVCYPNDPHLDVTNPLDPAPWAEGTGFCNEFDPMEGFPTSASEEASITSSAAGDFLYGTWGQVNLDDLGEFIDADVMFRRVWYLDDYIPSNAWTKGNQ
jgi:hypothetical protein